MPTHDPRDARTDELLLVWVARRTGVLDALLTDAGTVAGVAAAAGVEARTARLLVAGLADLGFVRDVEGEYEPTNRALGLLAKRDLRSVGRLPHELDRLDRLAATTGREGSRDGDDGGRSAPEPPDWTVNRLGAHAATDVATVRAAVTAAVRAGPRDARVVDVGGGSGVYAREFATRGHSVTLVEEPHVVEAVGASLAGTPVTLRQGTVAEPPFDVAVDASDDGDGGRDLVFAAGHLGRLDADDGPAFAAAVADVLDGGGTAVLVDAYADRGATARETLSVLAAGQGDVHGTATVEGWLADAGFGTTRVDDVPGTRFDAVVGRR